MNLSTLTLFLDLLDRSAQYLPFLLGGVVVVVLGLWGWTKIRGTRGGGGGGFVRLPSAAPLSSPTSKATYLARESAQHVAQSIDWRSRGYLMQAFQSAVKAQVMAQTAKDICDETQRLSDSLGVDIFEYLSYTSSVLADVENQIKR
jgi:hypothetical protein